MIYVQSQDGTSKAKNMELRGFVIGIIGLATAKVTRPFQEVKTKGTNRF
jgi:hypothetical protein